jgi:DNA-binding transcriptional regulator LsrR (DeoR family)
VRKIKEMLRLHFEVGLTNRQIARSLSVSHSTVNDLLGRFQVAGLDWPLP